MDGDLRVDRSAFSVVSLRQPSEDKEYWATKSRAERLAALELLRQVLYDYDPATARLQRVLTVTSGKRR